jgi:hypothetical protein
MQAQKALLYVGDKTHAMLREEQRMSWNKLFEVA